MSQKQSASGARKPKSVDSSIESRRLPTDAMAAWAAVAGILGGIGIIVLAVATMVADAPQPLPLSIALLVIGGLEILCGGLTLFGNRVGWSFFVALNGTLFIATFFGAPKIRDIAEISMSGALLPAGAFALLAGFAGFDHDRFA